MMEDWVNKTILRVCTNNDCSDITYEFTADMNKFLKKADPLVKEAVLLVLARAIAQYSYLWSDTENEKNAGR